MKWIGTAQIDLNGLKKERTVVQMKRFLIRGLNSFLLGAMGLLASGCFTPNVRLLSSDTTVARIGLRTGWCYRVNIDVEHLGRDLRVQMPDGKILHTSEITPQTIWPYTFFGKIGNKVPADLERSNRTYDVFLECSYWTTGGGYGFEFQQGRLVGLGVGVFRPDTPAACHPALGTETEMFVFPLREEQLIKLVGPLPTSQEVHE